VCFPISRFVVVSSLVYVRARDVGFANLGFPSIDRSDRCRPQLGFCSCECPGVSQSLGLLLFRVWPVLELGVDVP
jgi:hypothetical protein